jgi:hypothetical protein
MARPTTKSSSGTSKTAAESRAKSTKSVGRSRPSTKATARKRSAPKATAGKRSPSKVTANRRSSSKAIGRTRASAATRAKRSRKQSRSGVSATVASLVEKKPVLAGSAAVAGIAVVAAGLALKPKHRGNSVGDGLVRAGERIGKLGSDIQHAGDTAQNVGDALSK